VRPFDPRLLRYAGATRPLLAALAALAVVQVSLAVATAALVAEVVAAVFQEGASLADESAALMALGGVVLLRPLATYLQELAASRTSARVKRDLSDHVVDHVAALGPRWLVGARRSRLLVLLGEGLDALDQYFARYLPQLVSSLVIPLVVVVAVGSADLLSAVVIAVTLPLIPVFMVLIGWRTQAEQRKQWDALQTLSNHFLDVLRGLVTLKVFGRAEGQGRAIAEVNDRYRRRTMRVLRISFLSSFTLELLATLSVAVVAVEIGLRLVEGSVGLQTALFVLVLAPEAYLPLRQVGVHYHASQEGLAAAEEVFAILETPLSPAAPAEPLDLARTGLQLDDVRVRHPGRVHDSLHTTFQVLPGETVALMGPSGGGKSTALGVALGVVAPDAGRVRAGSASDPAAWRTQVGWLPQHPGFVRGTIADNVRVVAPQASDDEVVEALRLAGADFVESLPVGIHTVLGERGSGLSVGQRQRIALARVIVRRARVLMLDEPTSGLDGVTERTVVRTIEELSRGRTVLLVAHRPALAATADRTVLVLPPGGGDDDA
jgi:ATP-binding cassette, subfamily C, bacterial CydCD